MYMRDRYLKDAMIKSGVSTRNLAESLGVKCAHLSSFVGGFKYMAYKHADRICEVLNLDLKEFEKHIEMTKKEKKTTGKDYIHECEHESYRAGCWRAREMEKEEVEKKQKNKTKDKVLSTLERRVAYAKKLGITYGELQRRMYFDRELYHMFYD